MGDVKLLSEPTNYAVVHLAGRAFPGVVFQGDSLDTFIADLEEAVRTDDPHEKSFVLRDVIERLRGVQAHYEAVLNREGTGLPYTRS
jgi:hypothetical protein